jgi:hypothetical protein
MNKNEIKENFECSCCGTMFRSTIELQAKWDVDTGYGYCDRCSKDLEDRNEREWRKAEKTFSEALSPNNKDQFWNMPMEERRGLLIQAMDDGILQWRINR